MGQARREAEEVGLGRPAGVLADVGVDRQPGRLVGDERVVLLAEVAGEGEVRPRRHERHVGRHRRVVRPVELGDDRADGRVHARPSGLIRGSASQVGRSGRPCSARGCCAGQSTERMIVNWSSIAACFGRCSQMRTPGSLVGMTPNGPRFSSGRSGLGSQVSMWLGPPAIQSRMTLLLPPIGRPASDARARLPEQAGQAQPGQPRQAGLEHVAAAGDDQALPAPAG